MDARQLIAEVRDLSAPSSTEAPQALAVALGGLISEFSATAADRGVPPVASSGPYGRLLLNSPDDPFQIVVALWSPGAASPIHDHAGTVGAVSAISGRCEETKYEVVQDDTGAGVLLRRGATLELVPGTVTPILPDEATQLHAMWNPTAEWAATVHVYLTAIHSYRTYTGTEDGRHQVGTRSLWFDRTDCWSLWHPSTAALS